MSIFISHPISNRDVNISPRVLSPLANMGVSGWYGVWYENCVASLYGRYNPFRAWLGSYWCVVRRHDRPLNCCLIFLTMQALCDLVLSCLKISMSANEWLSIWGTTCALSTFSRYATPMRLPCKICKSNLQLNEKHPRHLHRRHRPFPSWNSVFISRQTRTRLSTGRNKNRLSSD